MGNPHCQPLSFPLASTRSGLRLPERACGHQAQVRGRGFGSYSGALVAQEQHGSSSCAGIFRNGKQLLNVPFSDLWFKAPAWSDDFIPVWKPVLCPLFQLAFLPSFITLASNLVERIELSKALNRNRGCRSGNRISIVVPTRSRKKSRFSKFFESSPSLEGPFW